MITQEEIIKVKLFEIIANNSRDLCNIDKHMSPLSVAAHVNDVYKYLFENTSNMTQEEVKNKMQYEYE